MFRPTDVKKSGLRLEESITGRRKRRKKKKKKKNQSQNPPSPLANSGK
jgi:hypothetical protein